MVRVIARTLATMNTGLTVALLVLVTASGASAQQYRDELLVLEVPEGFEGPVEESPGPQAKTVAYTKPYARADGGTLFQITEFDMGEALRGMPEGERGATADFYLAQLLGGVERRRTNFTATAPQRLELGGLPAARATWTGVAAGQRASGVMYCVVVGTVVVSFHTQDIESAPPENRAAAIRAFESVVVRDGG
jgi:hypothetical protein